MLVALFLEFVTNVQKKKIKGTGESHMKCIHLLHFDLFSLLHFSFPDGYQYHKIVTFNIYTCTKMHMFSVWL